MCSVCSLFNCSLAGRFKFLQLISKHLGLVFIFFSLLLSINNFLFQIKNFLGELRFNIFKFLFNLTQLSFKVAFFLAFNFVLAGQFFQFLFILFFRFFQLSVFGFDHRLFFGNLLFLLCNMLFHSLTLGFLLGFVFFHVLL